MEILAQVGGSAYALVAFAIGLRLIVLGLRTRHLPELLVGAGLFLLAGLGYPLSAVAREATELSGPTRAALGACAGVLAAVGLAANTGFTFVLFRRDASWALALVAAVAAFSVLLFVAQTLGGDWEHGATFWGWLPGAITVSFGWACVESLRYQRMLQRRLRLGLADPIVTNRFGLYATATGVGVLLNLVGWVYWHLRIEMLTDPGGGLLLFLGGSTSSVLMLLAFLPPQRYLAWLRARAPEVA